MENQILPRTNWKEVLCRNTQLKYLFEYIIPAHKLRNEPLVHLMFETNSEQIKENIFHEINKELSANYKIHHFDRNTKEGELGALLTNLGDGDILVLSGINNLKPSILEILFQAQETFVLNITIGKGIAARNISLPLPRFTMLLFIDSILELPELIKRRIPEIIRIKEFSEDELIEFAICDNAEQFGVLVTEENLPVIRDIAKNTNIKMALTMVQNYLFLHPEITQPITKETLGKIK